MQQRENRAVAGPDVHANGELVSSIRNFDGLTQEELADRAGCSRATIIRMEQGHSVKLAYLESVALVFHVPVDCLKGKANGVDPLATPRGREWDPRHAAVIDSFRTLPHGLQVRCCKLPSQTIPGVFGRLKFYDMSDFRWDDRGAAMETLRRHSEACRHVQSPYVIRCYICEPDSSGRYCVVVDEWLEAQLLKAAFGDSVPSNLHRIAYELLLGLQALHEKGIVCRGLSPYTVLLKPCQSVVIADLELAKLLAHNRTIRPRNGFVHDRFLAPEVYEQGRQIGYASDLFSWAVTVTWLAGGKLIPTNQISKSLLCDLGIPRDVGGVIEDSLSLNWTKRPQDVDSVLEPVAAWAKSALS